MGGYLGWGQVVLVDVVVAQAGAGGEERGAGGLIGEDVDAAFIDVHWRGWRGGAWHFWGDVVRGRVVGASASSEEAQGVHFGGWVVG